MELMLPGEPISTAHAIRISLVNRIVPAEQVLPQARAMAEAIAQNAPVAVQAVKRTVIAASGRPLHEASQLEDDVKVLVLASEDAKKGPRVFMEKRTAASIGR